jgi:hypothetical protein
MPVRRFPVYRSGTVATISLVLASAKAAEKLPTTVATISRSEPQRLQRRIDWSFLRSSSRNHNMLGLRIARARHLSLSQWMPHAHLD